MSNITPERLKALSEFQDALDAETDRGCALLAVALLDTELGKLLEHSFVGTTKVTTELLSPSGPLGTFSARIDLTYALGNITSTIRRDLHILRKIRNDFGHSPRPIDFSYHSISNRTNELTTVDSQMGSSPRQLFVSSVIGCLGAIHGVLPPDKSNHKIVKLRPRPISKARAR